MSLLIQCTLSITRQVLKILLVLRDGLLNKDRKGERLLLLLLLYIYNVCLDDYYYYYYYYYYY